MMDGRSVRPRQGIRLGTGWRMTDGSVDCSGVETRWYAKQAATDIGKRSIACDLTVDIDDRAQPKGREDQGWNDCWSWVHDNVYV